MARRASSARRYAEAAFQLADADGSHDRWTQDLQAAADLLADERVKRILDDPSIPSSDRASLVTKLLGKRATRSTVNLVRLLADRGRTELLPEIAAAFRALLNRRRGIVEATVTSARPLDPREEEAVRERIASMTGATVELAASVDESLIGGLTIRVGDRLLDASVRGRLERLRQQLIAGGSLAR